MQASYIIADKLFWNSSLDSCCVSFSLAQSEEHNVFWAQSCERWSGPSFAYEHNESRWVWTAADNNDIASLFTHVRRVIARAVMMKTEKQWNMQNIKQMKYGTKRKTHKNISEYI